MATLLTDELKGELLGTSATARLVFKASENGFKSTQFHAVCDDIGPTLTIVLSENGSIFGGFTAASWKGTAFDYVNDPSGKSFVFSARRPHLSSIDGSSVLIFPLQQTRALYSSSGTGPAFGDGCDVYVSHECNVRPDSYTRFPYRCDLLAGLSPALKEARQQVKWCEFLAGAEHFLVTEYEVFAVDGK